MASLNFANSNSGPMAASIGWFDFTGVTLNPGATLNLANSIPNGGNISFTISNTMISGNIIFSGHVAPQRAGIPFGSTNYTGIAGQPLLNATVATNGRADITMSNLIVTNSQGNTIPFGLVVAEGEGSIQNELITCTTNGTSWKLIANIYGSVANISGLNTTIVSWGGANPWPSPVVATNNPTSIIVNDFENSNSAIALGVILTPISITKNIVNRLNITDQFQLSITGPQSYTSITSGIAPGTQPNYAYIYGEDGGTYILNESMAPGSLNGLNNYIATFTIVNSSQGGTTIPNNWKLGDPLTVQMGDNISLSITNTPIIPKLNITKISSLAYGSVKDTIDYTIVLTNTYPNSTTNTTLIDTIPIGSTLVPNSIFVNGSEVTGSTNPPTGLLIGTIPGNSITTVTFKVIPNTLPSIATPIVNSAVVTHSYTVVSNTPPAYTSQSNITITTISSAILSSSKIVNKTTANIGDILTYTIALSNSGNTTAYNILFIDTIPNSTILISNTLKQDGISIAGTPDPPGIILPNSIAANKTSTISFQVLIVTTPNVYTATNDSTSAYNFLVNGVSIPNVINTSIVESNTVVTTINGIALVNLIKTVDRGYSTCGDIVSYTIVGNNIGNTDASNLIFIDTLPIGMSFIPNSFTFNGTTIVNADPNLGITLPNLSPNSTFTLGFKGIVNCN